MPKRQTTKQPHGLCGAKAKGTGKPCQRRPMENGRCPMHGGKSTGAPEGNQNARKHGLFTPTLRETGLVAYGQAKEMEPDAIAKDSAEFLVAKVVEAYQVDDEVYAAQGPVKQALNALVESEAISREVYERIIDKIYTPDLGTLARVMAPLKGLLELKHKADVEAKKQSAGPDSSEFDGSLWEDAEDGGDS